MDYLTKDFKTKEFECSCGCGLARISPTVALLCQLVRNKFNKPVTVTSGSRCTKYNKKVGGKDLSQHLLKGDEFTHAADIQVKGVSPLEVYTFLNGLFPNCLGLGIYNTFVHIDDRMSRAYRW